MVENKKAISIRISKPTERYIDNLAARLGWSRTKVIERAVKGASDGIEIILGHVPDYKTPVNNIAAAGLFISSIMFMFPDSEMPDTLRELIKQKLNSYAEKINEILTTDLNAKKEGSDIHRIFELGDNLLLQYLVSGRENEVTFHIKYY